MPKFLNKLAVQAVAIIVLGLILVGCTSAGAAPSVENAVQVIIPAAELTQTGNRIPFMLYDGPEPVRDAESVIIQLVDLTSNSEPQPLEWQAEADNYSDYAVPYWVIAPEFPTPGIWGLQATITLADGTVTTSDFVVDIKPEVDVVSIGEPAPLSQNRTLADVPDLATLTSDWEPQEALYLQTVADAIATGQPTVVSFATPAFCQTIFCAPVINTIKDAQTKLGADANFIHIEVFGNHADVEDFADLEFVPEMEEWGLRTEPWTFVIDGAGIVTHQLQGPVSLREIQLALESLQS